MTTQSPDYPVLPEHEFNQCYREALKDVACAAAPKAIYIRLKDETDSDDDNPVAGSVFADTEINGGASDDCRLLITYDRALDVVYRCIDNDDGHAVARCYDIYRQGGQER